MSGSSATERPPVVLLHGWGGSFQHTWVRLGWAHCLESNGFPIIEHDLPGHGVPEAPRDPQAYATILDDLDARLGHLDGVVGIGYSLGAKLMLALACRHPHMFSQLVLVGCGDNAFKPLGASELLARALREGLPPDAPPALVKLIDDVKASGNDPEAMAACITRPQENPLTEAQLGAGLGGAVAGSRVGRQSHWNACSVQQARGLPGEEPQGECRRLQRCTRSPLPASNCTGVCLLTFNGVVCENRGAVRLKMLCSVCLGA